MNVTGPKTMNQAEVNMNWPKKDAKLFVDSGEYHETGFFGWSSTQTSFAGYIHGYKSAADELVAHLKIRRSIGYSDTIIFPVIFLYRQSIELALKETYFFYSKASLNEKIGAVKKIQHQLVPMWNEVKKLLLEESCGSSDVEDIENAEVYIKQFSELDKSSFRFRYPITKDFTPTNSEKQRINLVNLKDRMDEIHAFLRASINCLDDARRIEMDAMRYFSELDDFEEYGVDFQIGDQ